MWRTNMRVGLEAVPGQASLLLGCSQLASGRHEIMQQLLLLHRTGPMSSRSHSKNGIKRPKVATCEVSCIRQRPPSVLVLIAATVFLAQHSLCA